MSKAEFVNFRKKKKGCPNKMNKIFQTQRKFIKGLIVYGNKFILGANRPQVCEGDKLPKTHSCPLSKCTSASSPSPKVAREMRRSPENINNLRVMCRHQWLIGNENVVDRWHKGAGRLDWCCYLSGVRFLIMWFMTIIADSLAHSFPDHSALLASFYLLAPLLQHLSAERTF